jgi:hypothetical protein
MRMLADSSLDAAAYFYAGETLFFVVTGAVFFIFGLWAGNIIWGRYKRKFQKSLDQIETYKGEIAQFKRRMAERVPNAAPQAAVLTPPAPTPAPAPASLSPLAALVRGNLKPQEMPVGPRAYPSFPPGRGFSVWTEEGWEAPHVILPPRAPGAAFTLWTQQGPPEDHEESKAGTTISTSTHAADSGWLYTYEHSDHHAVHLNRSHAHSVWTEQHWTPHPVTQPPTPPAVAFSLWMLPDFVPPMRGFQRPAQPFSLWTAPDWSPPKLNGVPLRSARGFSLWTEDDFVPTGRGPVRPSQAWSLWTAPDWEPPLEKQPPQPVSAAFSVWSDATPHGANGEKAPTPEPDPRKTQGSVFARVLAAARAAFKAG